MILEGFRMLSSATLYASELRKQGIPVNVRKSPVGGWVVEYPADQEMIWGVPTIER